MPNTMLNPKIKICGITQADNVAPFAALIDAIGLVFYDKSSRYINTQTANSIIDVLPPFVARVGLFVNAHPDFITQIINSTAIDTLQFHGDETPQECAQYGLPYIKVIRVQTDTNLSQLSNDYHQAAGLLLDAYHPNEFGGTGQVFDWALAKDTQEVLALPKIIAGGLTPDNVKQCITQTQPYALDVSSGVESAPGIKDLTKVLNFIHNTRQP